MHYLFTVHLNTKRFPLQVILSHQSLKKRSNLFLNTELSCVLLFFLHHLFFCNENLKNFHHGQKHVFSLFTLKPSKTCRKEMKLSCILIHLKNWINNFFICQIKVRCGCQKLYIFRKQHCSSNYQQHQSLSVTYMYFNCINLRN